MHIRLSTILLLLALSLSGCRTAAPPPHDTALNSAVQSKLASDIAISAEPIQTSVQSGVAILQGTVSSEAARALAASDVSQVQGIRSVVNQLTVQAPTQASVKPQPATGAPVPAPSRPSPTPQRHAPPPPVRTSRYTPPAPVQPASSAPIERRTPDQSAQQEAPSQPAPRAQQPPAAPSFRNITVPSGTTLPIRITQTLSSATAQSGDTFSGSLASDVVIDGLVALPAGTTVSGRIDEVHEAAHFKGSALLTISLTSINRHGERTTIATEPYTEEGKGRGKNTATKVGGGAAIGAILGGILGGGKGAAIGAATGGGVGAGANGITRGEQVQIASETLIRFRLADSITVRASTSPASETDPNLQRRSGS